MNSDLNDLTFNALIRDELVNIVPSVQFIIMMLMDIKNTIELLAIGVSCL